MTPLLLALLSAAPARAVVLISADTEWKLVRENFPHAALSSSPTGETFDADLSVAGRPRRVPFIHGGWGKIAAAASAQAAIDRYHPDLLVNLGTCGGFRGSIQRGQTLLVDETIVYDIVEQMGDPDEAIAAFTTAIDTGWAGTVLPGGVTRGKLLSGDRDIVVGDIPRLRTRYGAAAADWESGAIAWVAAKNHTPVLILRAVSDLVGTEGGEAYGDGGIATWESAARPLIRHLIDGLPAWLARFDAARPLNGGR